jgi:hypothetical protein
MHTDQNLLAQKSRQLFNLSSPGQSLHETHKLIIILSNIKKTSIFIKLNSNFLHIVRFSLPLKLSKVKQYSYKLYYFINSVGFCIYFITSSFI